MKAPRKPRAGTAKSPGKSSARTKTRAKAPESPPRKAAAKTAARKAPAKAPKKAPARVPGKAPAKAKPARRAKPRLEPARQTLALIEKLLDEHQAEDISVVSLAGKTAIADYMVVASGRNPRHIGAMADHLRTKLKDATGRTPPVEGIGSADWVLVDAGDVIVHLFRPEVRAAYNLEKMWGADWSGSVEGAEPRHRRSAEE